MLRNFRPHSAQKGIERDVGLVATTDEGADVVFGEIWDRCPRRGSMTPYYMGAYTSLVAEKICRILNKHWDDPDGRSDERNDA